MSIAFLYPLVWLGGLAIAVPVWLHLRRRVERNVVRFSALQFLEDQPMPQRSPLRLRDLLLLAMRVLAVLLLLAAFAWPYNPEVLTEKPSESRVYLLDNTLSHQASAGFTRARNRLADEIEGAGPEAQIAVIELTARPQVISYFGESHQAVAQKVRTLEASFQRGSYTSAFRQVDALLADALGQRKRVLIYSDNQKNQWTEMLEAAPFLRDVEIEMVTTHEAAAANVALARPRVQRTFIGNESIVDLAVEVYHLGPLKTATVTIQANGKGIASRPVQLADQPEWAVFTAQWPADPGDYLSGEVSITGEPDALAGDNRVFFSLPPMKEGRVTLLADSPFLRAALSPEVMGGYWATRLLEPAEAAEELRAAELADALCLESKYLRSSDVRDLVMRYLNNRRAVLLIVNQMSPVVRTFLSQFGFEAQPNAAEVAETSTFRYVFTGHPVFRPFRSPDFGNLMDINIFRHNRLRATQATPLIFSQSGDGLFYQATDTKGPLLVCAFGFERSDTDWPLHPTFVPFLDLCFQNARGDADVVTTFEPGDMFVQDVPVEEPVHEFVLKDRAGELRRGPVEDGRVEFAVPEKPGSYMLTYDADMADPMVLSVNASPLESDLTHLKASEDVESRLVRSSVDDPKPEVINASAKLTRSQIVRQNIWWFALLAGLALLFGESTWLAAAKERT